MPDGPPVGEELYAIGAPHPGDLFQDTGSGCGPHPREAGFTYHSLAPGEWSMLQALIEN